ncbi:Exosome complex component Rrp41 [Aphelenchoides besseyi]|nr:Exosome complex component Rrp41 [Aphelenchoides besseyi]
MRTAKPKAAATMECKLGLIEGADGSCELKRGESRAVAILQGPTQIGNEHEKIYRHVGFVNFHATNFHFDDPRPGNSLLYDLLEQCIDRAAYPRIEFVIHVNRESVHNHGVDVLSFNAANLCLLDAAIRMNFYFVAILVAMLEDKKTGNFDLEFMPNRLFLFVFRPSSAESLLVGSCSHGRFTLNESEEALELARGRCLNAVDFVRYRIRQKLQYGIELKSEV